MSTTHEHAKSLEQAIVDRGWDPKHFIISGINKEAKHEDRRYRSFSRQMRVLLNSLICEENTEGEEADLLRRLLNIKLVPDGFDVQWDNNSIVVLEYEKAHRSDAAKYYELADALDAVGWEIHLLTYHEGVRAWSECNVFMSMCVDMARSPIKKEAR